jgi:HIV Tat-specific factor 1
MQKMEGRFFAGKKLQAEYYDGVSNYHVEESEEMKQERIKKWNSWLEGDENESEK